MRVQATAFLRQQPERGPRRGHGQPVPVDERAIHHVRHSQLLGIGQFASGRHDRDPRLDREREDVQPLVFKRRADERDVHPVAQQPAELAGEVERDETELDVRVSGAEALQNRHREVGGIADEQSDTQMPGETGGVCPHLRHRPVGIGEQPLRVLEQQPSRLGQHHMTAVTLEQWSADMAFKNPDLLTQRRHREIQPGGGTAEMQFLRHGHEIAEMTKLHLSAAF
jgi:hypothetical protein